MGAFILIIVVIIAWYLVDKNKKSSIKSLDEPNLIANKERWGDEQINKIQLVFEKRLTERYLPDAISPKEIYIFKKLMFPWYQKLSGKYRYNEEMQQKINDDWVSYMSALEDASTYLFLSLEWGEDEDNAENYNKHILARKQILNIENAFASEIGEDAQQEIEKIRSIQEHSKFSSDGKLAPKDHIYDDDNVLVKEAK